MSVRSRNPAVVLRVGVLGLTALGLVVLGTARAPAEDAPHAPVLSSHYALSSEGPRGEAEEFSRVLEAAWPAYEAFFGAAPRLAEGQRLAVWFFEDRGRWLEAIERAGGVPPTAPGVGGYYDPVSRGVFLWRQPTLWFTRALLIHEAAHQFHYLSRTNNRSLPVGWYVEGVAEHLSHHTWDGRTLRIGVTPPISLEDYAGKALSEATAPAFSLAGLLAPGAGASRPVGMHLVRYLVSTDDIRKRFTPFARKLDRGLAADPADFGRAFGPAPQFEKAWRAWLPTVQQPFLCGHVDWDARGADAIRGTSQVVAACRTQGRVRRLAARFAPPEGPWRAGLLLRWVGPGDFTVYLLDGAGVSTVDERRDGAWHRLPPPAAPPARGDGAFDLVGEVRTDRVVVSVNGAEVGAWPIPSPTLGLAVDHATVDFTGIRLD